tara:strand:+ start:20 stop:304 length:285 start_codon:yes stop_codon:yes gene_type:complete
MRNENELIWKTLTEGTDEFDDDSSKGVSRIDANTNFITKMISARAVECVESIDTIYGLVEDRGSEMLDKQAAEKLEDIIEHASNALRELSMRLD